MKPAASASAIAAATTAPPASTGTGCTTKSAPAATSCGSNAGKTVLAEAGT